MIECNRQVPSKFNAIQTWLFSIAPGAPPIPIILIVCPPYPTIRVPVVKKKILPQYHMRIYKELYTPYPIIIYT